MDCFKPIFLLVLFLLLIDRQVVVALLLLRDLATPCFLMDVDAIAKHELPSICSTERALPPLSIQDHVFTLKTDGFAGPEGYHLSQDPTASPLHLWDASSSEQLEHSSTCYGYIHTRVVQGKTESFLAQLDVPPLSDSDASSIDSHLVLGLNNHHVISYYWARSAGAGAAMEAPGIVVDNGCYLRWAAGSEGFTDCNSNDGKRSEWVNFVRPGDQVQLRPHRPAEAMLRFNHVWGVSSAGRPLGAEPYIVGEFLR